jgi:predicted nucleic acid-binding protein
VPSSSAAEIAAEAMRAYTRETNRLNRQRQSSAESTRRELAETAKAIAEIVRVIEQGGWHRALSDRLTELEAKQDNLTARLSNGPEDVPDIHPNTSEAYRRRIERLTETLSDPDDALEAADAIREVIDRIVITPGQQRGENHVTLRGDLATILEWIERTGKPGYKPATDTASSRLSVSVKTRGATGNAIATAGNVTSRSENNPIKARRNRCVMHPSVQIRLLLVGMYGKWQGEHQSSLGSNVSLGSRLCKNAASHSETALDQQ